MKTVTDKSGNILHTPHRSDNSTSGGATIGAAIGRLHAALQRATRGALATRSIGLNCSQVQVMRCLAAHGAMSAAELIRAFPYDSGGMTRLIDQLEGQGLARRRRDQADRRVQKVALTRAGQQLNRQLTDLSERILDRALGNLDPMDRTRLMDYVQRMLTALHGPGEV